MRALLSLTLFASLVPSASWSRASEGDLIDFNRDVRPILSRNCFACHGQDAGKRATKMRLDVRASATQTLRKGGAAIVPGKPEDSVLYRRIAAQDEADRMPPAESGNHLKPEQIEILRRWIA